jgi:hypothetical protein
MVKYIVYVAEVHTIPVYVSAKDKDEAQKKAAIILEDGSYDLDPEYSHTLPVDQWEVIKE